MSEKQSSAAAESASAIFWSIILVMLGVGGGYVWYVFHGAPERERQAQCERSCHALNSGYVDVTDYGCFCIDDGIPFVLDEAGAPRD